MESSKESGLGYKPSGLILFVTGESVGPATSRFVDLAMEGCAVLF